MVLITTFISPLTRIPWRAPAQHSSNIEQIILLLLLASHFSPHSSILSPDISSELQLTALE